MKLCIIGDDIRLVDADRYNKIRTEDANKFITSNEFRKNSEYAADAFVIQTVSNIDQILGLLIEAVQLHDHSRESDYIDILIYAELDADMDELMRCRFLHDPRARIGVMTHVDLHDRSTGKHRQRWVIEYLSADDTGTECMRYDYENRIKNILSDMHYNTLISHNAKIFLDSGGITQLNRMTREIKSVRDSYSKADDETLNKLTETIIS
jgi:hypothetical protein